MSEAQHDIEAPTPAPGVEPIAGTQRLDLGDVLLRVTRLEPEQLAEARARQAESGERLSDVLVEEGMLNSDEVLLGMAEQLGLPLHSALGPEDIDDAMAQNVPIGFAKQHRLLPIGRTASDAVRVVAASPLDMAPLDDLRMLFDGAEIELELAGERLILNAINQVYDRGPGSTDQLAEEAEDDLDALAGEISGEPQDLIESTDDAPIIRLVNSMLQHAVKERASDLHIQPFERDIRVRFRIDDVLYEPMKPLPRRLQASIASRIKIMGGLDIAEKRLPQDGRIRLKIAGRDYDVRLSTVPVTYGERLVLRLLPDTQELVDLERIGFSEHQREAIERIIKRPNGIFLVTGPTGSGKTTTLYAALKRLNKPDTKIITAENPVEYNLMGINQAEVNHEIGRTFAIILKAMLRQAPNIILVGEIRDEETATVAIQAALTGHLVFSTLHTNDAPSAISRLTDMGVKPFLVASAIMAILAQRLVRRLCKECKEPLTDPREIPEWQYKAVKLDPRNLKGKRIYLPIGCDTCNGLGYKGRCGAYELMEMTMKLRELAFAEAHTTEIRNAAIEGGMSTLQIDGVRKVLDGVTTIEEVLSITHRQDLQLS